MEENLISSFDGWRGLRITSSGPNQPKPTQTRSNEANTFSGLQGVSECEIVADDRNCQFSAFLVGLKRLRPSVYDHLSEEDMRTQAVDYIQAEVSDSAKFSICGDSVAKAEYCMRMRNQENLGDDHTLSALCGRFGVWAVVLMISNKTGNYSIHGDKSVDGPIVLRFHGGHYHAAPLMDGLMTQLLEATHAVERS